MYTLQQAPMRSIPFSEARAHLAETLQGVEASQQPVVISRRGRAAGVLVPVAQYAHLTDQLGGFAGRLARWRAEHAAPAHGGEHDFQQPEREAGEGRDFAW
jgi:prevent-host-death family protein